MDRKLSIELYKLIRDYQERVEHIKNTTKNNFYDKSRADKLYAEQKTLEGVLYNLKNIYNGINNAQN